MPAFIIDYYIVQLYVYAIVWFDAIFLGLQSVLGCDPRVVNPCDAAAGVLCSGISH